MTLNLTNWQSLSRLNTVRDVECNCEKHGRYMGREWLRRDEVVQADLECPICRAELLNSPEHKAAVEAFEKEMRELEEAQKKAEEERQAEIEHDAFIAKMARMRIPNDYIGTTLDDVRPIDQTVAEAVKQAKLYVSNYDKLASDGLGFVFYGAFGTGKTMLSCAILQALSDRVEGLYVTIWQLMKIVKDSESYGADTKELRRLTKVPVLVIDEIGAQQGNSFEEGLLMQVVDVRVSHKRPTIFVTNLLPASKDEKRKDTLQAKLGKRLFNRIVGRSWFLMFKGESQRKRLPSIYEMLKADGWNGSQKANMEAV